MFQFAHIEGYALSASSKVAKTKDGKAASAPKRDIGGIVGEVMRDDGFCMHVDNPKPPVFHHGDADAMRGLVGRIQKNVEEWKRLTRKTLRKDAQVLLTEVVSFPKDGPGFDDWRRRNIDHLKKKYGSQLVAIVEHEDEENPHLHAYVVADFGKCPDIKKELHPGYVAAAGIKEPKLQRDAFTKGMRTFQDEYYRDVGMYCGMVRLGPGKKRLARGVYMAEKAQAQSIKAALETVAARQVELDAMKSGLDSLVSEKAAALKRADAVALMKKNVPSIPEEPRAWEPMKLAKFVESLKKIIQVQAVQLACIPAMRDAMAAIRSEGAKMKQEKDDLVDRVKVLAEQAQAWAVVKQVYPDVAAEVVRRMNKVAEQGRVVETPGHGVSGPSVASPPLEPVLSM